MSPTALQGQDYRALRRLADVDNRTLAEVGATCERVPVDSLTALVESGKVELAVERRATAASTPAAAPPNRRKKGTR